MRKIKQQQQLANKLHEALELAHKIELAETKQSVGFAAVPKAKAGKAETTEAANLDPDPEPQCAIILRALKATYKQLLKNTCDELDAKLSIGTG